MTDAADLAPPLGPDDVYLYAHANGAICLLRADATSGLVPLDEAVSVAVAHTGAGGRVHLDHEDGPLAAQLVEGLAAEGIPVVPFDSPRPPDEWPHGTDALMEAARYGADRLLDDLLARGADLHRVDDSGSTALHHAAIAGNGHAIEALVTAGARIDAANAAGMTPRMLAAEAGDDATVGVLDSLGAASAPAAGRVEFPTQLMTSARAYAVLIAANLVIAVVLLWPPSLWDPLVLALVCGALWLFTPPFAFWHGGAAVSLDGAVLSYQPMVGGVRSLDLGRVTVVASGGSTRSEVRFGARNLVLGHPDGAPMTARSLRDMVTIQDEVDLLLHRSDRFVVITLRGTDRGAILPPIGAALAASGAEVLPSAARQVADARRLGWQPPDR